mgnify:CR=1
MLLSAIFLCQNASMAEKEYEEIDLKHNFLRPLRLIPDSPKSL